jgi:hypothetical protein
MRLDLKSCLAGDAIGLGDPKANVGLQSVHWEQYSCHCSYLASVIAPYKAILADFASFQCVLHLVGVASLFGGRMLWQARSLRGKTG